MRMSTSRSEEGFRGLLNLAGGRFSLVMAALEPDEQGRPVSYATAIERIRADPHRP